MDSEPDFYFNCATNPPASLCASRPTFSSGDLFTSVWETCRHHEAIRCCYLISLRTNMNRGVSLLNISVCFDYNIQVLWLTSSRCWADVGGRHQPNVEATLGRHRTADIDPTSAQHMFRCSFFFTPWFARTTLRRNRPNAGSSEQFWSSPGMVTDLLYTNMKTWFILTQWGPDKMDAIFPDDIFKCIFLNANIWILIKFSLFARVQLTMYTSLGSDNGLAPASDKPLFFCTLCLDPSVHLRNRTVTSLHMWILHWRRSHWCLKSPVTQLDCLFNRLFRQSSTPAFLILCEGIHRWSMGSPHKKPVTQPPLGQCWYNVGIQPLV